MKNKENAVLNATVGMALADALPVVFFALSGAMLALICRNLIFTLGIILCACAGLGKVAWKLLLAVYGKNVLLLNRQLRLLMPAGFLLILLYVCLNFAAIEWQAVFAALCSMPALVFFAICALLMIVMFVLSAKLNQNSVKANWAEQTVNAIAQFSLFIALLLLVK